MNNHIRSLTFAFILAVSSILGLGNSVQASQLNELVIAHDENSEPLSYIDETGAPCGYLIDVWKHFAEANHIRVRFLLGSWEESLEWVRTGKADIHGGLFRTDERECYLKFGPTIAPFPGGFYVNKNLSWKAGKTNPAGVMRKGFSESFMQNNYPHRTICSFPQTKAIVAAAARGQIDVFLADLPVATFYLRKFNAQDKFECREVAYTDILRAAVSKDREDLQLLLNNGWKRMNPKRLNYIRGKWFLEVDSDRQWVLISMLIAAFILLLGLIGRLLRKKSLSQ